MKSIEDRNQEGATCPRCERNNQTKYLKFMYISLEEMVLKCESSTCMFPCRNFKYKCVRDGSISQPRLTAPYTKDEIKICPTNNTSQEIANDSILDAFIDSLSLDNLNSDEKKTFIELKPICEYDYSGSVNSSFETIESKYTNSSESPQQGKHVKVDNDTDVRLSLHSCDGSMSTHSIPSADVKPTISQVQHTVNEDADKKQTTATISRYLDFIKAKHKKVKTVKKRQVNKCEKDANKLINKASNRPLDILKTIQAMK